MDKTEIKEYLIKEFIPKIERNIKIKREDIEKESDIDNELYNKAKECIIELMEYYADEYIPRDYKDIDDKILLTIESFISTTQTDPTFGIEIIRGDIDISDEEYTIDDLKRECSGFKKAYNNIIDMWDRYETTNDVLYSICGVFLPYLYDGSNKGFKMFNEKGDLKQYSRYDYKGVLNNFDNVMKFIKNQMCYEEDQIIGLLSILSQTDKPHELEVEIEEEKQLEVLNEILKIIESN